MRFFLFSRFLMPLAITNRFRLRERYFLFCKSCGAFYAQDGAKISGAETAVLILYDPENYKVLKRIPLESSYRPHCHCPSCGRLLGIAAGVPMQRRDVYVPISEEAPGREPLISLRP